MKNTVIKIRSVVIRIDLVSSGLVVGIRIRMRRIGWCNGKGNDKSNDKLSGLL